MIRTFIDMMVDDTSASMTIDVQDTEEEFDSLGIMTTDYVDPSSALRVIKNDIGMPAIHIKTELISNFALTMG